jgi:hypothetical protein
MRKMRHRLIYFIAIDVKNANSRGSFGACCSELG